MKIARKSLALLMVCALMLTTLGAVASFAASVDELVIEMVDGQLVITKNGEVFKTFDADAAEGIKLSRSAKTDKIVITFTDADGKTRNVALATDASISIEGEMGSVTLNKTLGDVAVSVAETATVDTLSIKNSGAVEVAGTVKDVNVTTKAANVTVTQTAKVDTLEAPKGVTIAGDGAANVGTTTVKEDPKPATPPVAPPPISGGGDYNWQDMNPSVPEVGISAYNVVEFKPFSVVPAAPKANPYQLMQINYNRKLLLESNKFTVTMKTPTADATADNNPVAGTLMWVGVSTDAIKPNANAWWQWGYRNGASLIEGGTTMPPPEDATRTKLEQDPANKYQLIAGAVVTFSITATHGGVPYTISQDYTITADDVTKSAMPKVSP